MKRDITKTVASLQDDMASLAEIRFASLNDLSREEQAVVADGWSLIPVDKRQRLLTVLNELANDDFQMDFTALFRIALKDTDAEVRRLAVDGLWMDEKPTIIRPLLMMLTQDESVEVRASAADMLGNWVLMGEYDQIPSERGSEIVETLLRTISNTTEASPVRARALESLGYSHDDRIPAIIERVYKAPDPQARRSALKAMGRHGDERWAATIRQELYNDDSAFRFEAARAAGEMGDRGSSARLIALLQDKDHEVREMAVWALGEVGGKPAETALKKLIKGEDAVMRKLAREALTELKMLDDASELAGLTLFNFGNEEETDIDEDDDYFAESEDDEFRSLMLNANWEEALSEDLEALEDEFGDDEDEDEAFDDEEWDEDEDDDDLDEDDEEWEEASDDEADDEEDDLSFLEEEDEDDEDNR